MKKTLKTFCVVDEDGEIVKIQYAKYSKKKSATRIIQCTVTYDDSKK